MDVRTDLPNIAVSSDLVQALTIYIIKETNCKMYMQYTVQLHYRVYPKELRSVDKKAAQEEDLREKWNGDL